jgi:hypothetical protein
MFAPGVGPWPGGGYPPFVPSPPPFDDGDSSVVWVCDDQWNDCEALFASKTYQDGGTHLSTHLFAARLLCRDSRTRDTSDAGLCGRLPPRGADDAELPQDQRFCVDRYGGGRILVFCATDVGRSGRAVMEWEVRHEARESNASATGSVQVGGTPRSTR